MALTQLRKRLIAWLARPFQSAQTAEVKRRGPQTHVIILDGTLSSLQPGYETHAGTTYHLCREMGAQVSVYYEAGVQWPTWGSTLDVLLGRGINRQIRRAYGFLASRYQPGDQVFLFGYSRGAYAVRSLAGVIDMVGLLRREHATTRNIRTAYRHYRTHPGGRHATDFSRAFCHDFIPIKVVGVWDTVKALGLRLPLLWRLAETRHSFHNHALGPSICNGFHALALNETRRVFRPVMWDCPPDWPGHLEQVWFRGSHADIGGQLGGYEAARPLANLSLVWMLTQAEAKGLPLPKGWPARFFTDPLAPSIGTWRGWGKIFLWRRRRRVGQDPSERLHESVQSPE